MINNHIKDNLDYRWISLMMSNYYTSLKERRASFPNTQYPHPLPTNPTEWMLMLRSVYDYDAQFAKFTEGGVTINSYPHLIEYVVNGVDCGYLGLPISKYWEAQVTPGDGATEVTNDAHKIREMIDDYMCSHIWGIGESIPHYEHLFRHIELCVNSIIWTCSDGSTTWESRIDSLQ